MRAEVRASLNGRPAELLLDDGRDLVSVDDGIGPADFVRPSPKTPPAHVEPVDG